MKKQFFLAEWIYCFFLHFGYLLVIYKTQIKILRLINY